MRHGEIREKLVDLFDPHLLGVTLVMKDDEASDPLHIGFFGAEAIVSGAQSVTHLFEEFGLLTTTGVSDREHTFTHGKRRKAHYNVMYPAHVYTIKKLSNSQRTIRGSAGRCGVLQPQSDVLTSMWPEKQRPLLATEMVVGFETMMGL